LLKLFVHHILKLFIDLFVICFCTSEFGSILLIHADIFLLMYILIIFVIDIIDVIGR